MTRAEECHLFGVVAASPLAMPWAQLELTPDAPASEVLPDSLDLVDDEDLRQLRERGALATSNATTWDAEEPPDTWLGLEID